MLVKRILAVSEECRAISEALNDSPNRLKLGAAQEAMDRAVTQIENARLQYVAMELGQD